MALDKERILNELNSVMSQLQGADCGCMNKLFASDQPQPASMGCGNMGGGCCRRAPCCAGRGGGVGRSCMPRCCNPVKMYTDTYDYLNTNLMQPTINEVMEDFKGMNSSNTVGAIGMPNTGGIGDTNMAKSGGMGMNPGDMDMPVGNANMGGTGMPAGKMGMPNMNHGNMGEQIMGMMNMFGGGKKGNMGHKPANFSSGNTGNSMMQNANPNALDTSNYMQGDQLSAHHGHQNQYMSQGHAHPMQHGGLTDPNAMLGDINMTSANVTQPSGQMTGNYDQPLMPALASQMNPAHDMYMQQGHTNQMGNPLHRGNANPAMFQGNTNVPSSNAMQQDGSMAPNISHPQSIHRNMNQIRNMQMGHRMNQMNVAPGGTPNVTQEDPNVTSPNVTQQIGNQGSPGAAATGQGNPNMGAHNQMGRMGYGRGNKGMTFSQLFPGGPADGGDLGFDPMEIAWQMNPANQKMAAINMMNKLMNGNKGFANYMHNFMGNPPLQQKPPGQAAPQSTQPPAETPKPTDEIESVAPPSGDPNSVPPNQPGAQLSAAPGQVTEIQENINGAAPPATTAEVPPVIKEPIYPAETRQPISHQSPREEYGFNALGQPIQLIPSERYHIKQNSLPQTLSPQSVPASQMRYSAVKSTISKTSIPRRSTIRVPSRGQVNLNRGTVSSTGPKVKHPAQGGSQSDGKLNQQVPTQQINKPMEAISKVAGDATSGKENSVPVKTDENKGLPEGTPMVETVGALTKGKHNGLQDRYFTSCANSSWSFGTPYMPYPYSYRPPPQRVGRRKY